MTGRWGHVGSGHAQLGLTMTYLTGGNERYRTRIEVRRTEVQIGRHQHREDI